MKQKFKPTPTQKRLLKKLKAYGEVKVRVTYPQPKGSPIGDPINAYERDQLYILAEQGFCKIVDRNNWEFKSNLTGYTLHGRTYTAKGA